MLGVVDTSISLSFFERRVLLWAGIALGVGVASGIRYAMHQAVTRRVLLPWGALGGMLVVFTVVARMHGVFNHGPFLVTTVFRALFTCIGLRLAIDAMYGPLPNPWEADAAQPVAASDPAFAIPDSAWYAVLRNPAPMAESKSEQPLELRLVDEKHEDHTPTPPKRKSGGTAR
ncbi:MAG: hypothetical protein JWO05_1349 [Gemmatimonadetes bacterium]|nr:hypothetical protein [Gemmatimonadota bacterium]